MYKVKVRLFSRIDFLRVLNLESESFSESSTGPRKCGGMSLKVEVKKQEEGWNIGARIFSCLLLPNKPMEIAFPQGQVC